MMNKLQSLEWSSTAKELLNQSVQPEDSVLNMSCTLYYDDSMSHTRLWWQDKETSVYYSSQRRVWQINSLISVAQMSARQPSDYFCPVVVQSWILDYLWALQTNGWRKSRGQCRWWLPWLPQSQGLNGILAWMSLVHFQFRPSINWQSRQSLV